MRGHGDELSRRVVMCQEFLKQSRSLFLVDKYTRAAAGAQPRWRTERTPVPSHESKWYASNRLISRHMHGR